MEGINHSSRERHSWSDRRGGWNGIKTFCPPSDRKELCPDHHVPLHHHHHLSPSPGLFNRGTTTRRPAIALLCPLAALHYSANVNYSPAARLTTEEFDVAATARHPPLRSTPPPPPVSSLSLPVADSWARSRAGELMGGKGEFGNRGGKVEAFDSNIYLSIRGVRSNPIRLFLLVFLFIFIPVNICTRFDWSC